MDQICGLYQISRQAHYQKYQRELERAAQEEIILELVRQLRRKHTRMGGRKLLYKLQPMLLGEELKIGRERLFDLLRSQDLLVQRKKTYRRTTIPGLFRAPNRLPGLEVNRFAYLFILMDLYSRYIVGWHFATTSAAEGALASLRGALGQLNTDPASLIHHSDHEVQYTSYAYMNTLLDHDIQASMGAVGNCYDNIFAERLMGILTGEYYLDSLFVKYLQVTSKADEVVDLYNTDISHLSLNLAVPIDVYHGYCDHVPPVVIPSLEVI